MANTVNIQVLEDGARFKTVNVTFSLDTSDLAETVIADPATSYFDPVGNQNLVFSVDWVQWNMPNGLIGRLQWKATANTDIINFVGSQEFPFRKFGSIQNNAGAGKTGQIVFTTNGYVIPAGPPTIPVLSGSFTLGIKKG